MKVGGVDFIICNYRKGKCLYKYWNDFVEFEKRNVRIGNRS